MAATQYVEPALGSFTYDQKIPANFGEAYAAGIGAAGKSLADAITTIGGMYQQNRDVDDTLKGLNKAKILTDDEYSAVAGKSTAAKQQMLGMFAGQWMADQAQNRAVALQKGQYAGEIDLGKAKMDQMLDMIKKGYPQLAGVDPKKQPLGPVQPTQPTQPTQLGPVAPSVPVPSAGNMLLRPGVTRGQMTDPKTGKIVMGWKMPDGSFTINKPAGQ